MKVVVAGTTLFCLVAACSRVLAQGSLTPPLGAPSPTMKSLQQVEPRFPISYVPYSITNSGAYYLASNLTGTVGMDGITIIANDVDLDLGGFVLSGVPGSGSGITTLGNQSNIRIHNGTVRNWSIDGVGAGGFNNGQIELVNVTANVSAGIRSGPGSTIINCSASYNYGIGIFAGANNLVKNCTSMGNFDYGIEALQGSSILDCVAGANTNAGIFLAGTGGTISRNTARLNGGSGIAISTGGIVSDNLAYLNAGHGIFAGGNCTIVRNNSSTNGVGAGYGAGIYSSGNDNRIENNHLLSNDAGLDLDGTRNYVAGNTVQGNTDNYDFAAGNELNLLIGQIPENIDWPAKVELAGSFTATSISQHGLNINADNVTVDLMGHTLTGTAGSTNFGIYIGFGHQFITIKNGTLRKWYGGLNAGYGSNCTFSAIGSHENFFYGFKIGSSSQIKDCSANRNTNYGFTIFDYNAFENCMAAENGNHGYSGGTYCSFTRCQAFGQTNSGSGFSTYYGCVLDSCQANGNAMWGMEGDYYHTFKNCVANNNGYGGISVTTGGIVEDCQVNENGTYGIQTGLNAVKVAGNTAYDNGIGIATSVSSNVLVVQNCVRGSTSGTNYSVIASNLTGPITNSTATTNPWANFSF